MSFTSVQKYCPADIDMLKIALKIPPEDTGQDDYLTILIEAAKEDADDYLQKDLGKKIPPSVTKWVVQDAVRAYENPDPTVTSKQVVGIGSETRTVDENTRFAGLSQKSLKSPIGGSQVY